ncbi:MAG: ABC transporter ATP-binding protein/permease [Clostridiales bacterium]|nr:ABC transporter ATP-binding protein/permease [Clostridiales bacterium]
MLKLVNIVKEYTVDKEEKTLALKGVSIAFRKNEFVSILGPSGCGKTTLLNIIGGLDRYTDGDIQIDGVSTKEYDDVDWDTYRNRKIGFVFQSYNLIPHMNILKNVAMSLTIGGVDREERKERALEALKKVGLAAQARKKPNQLSGGQMQRVAIARALVNNPDIILADEPTGALDSESGLQVMDLLKEVAEDRLVIMVTHNPMLAEEYSTRIVYLKDGEVEGDTMPFDPDEKITATSKSVESNESSDNHDDHDDMDGGEFSFEQQQFVFVKEGEQAVSLDSTDSQAESKAGSQIGTKLKKSLLDKLRKIRRADKSAMKLSTAISLSWANLLSKKGRTLLTSIAGSIGIIGIVLVLALSNGAGLYVNNLEESALSSYPIKVNKASTDIDITTIMSALVSSSGDGKFDEDIITTQEVLGNVITNILPTTSGNDLYSFKKYIDKNFDTSLARVSYDYGTSFNTFIIDPNNSDKYMKVNPYTEMMGMVLSDMLSAFPSFSDIKIPIMGNELTLDEAVGMMGENLGSPWEEMTDNMVLLNNQYDLVGNSRWPQKANEVVVVVNENNKLLDYELFMLGLKSTDDVIAAMGKNSGFADSTFSVDEILSLEFKLMTNVDYLIKNDGSETWTMHDRKELAKDFVDAHAMTFGKDADGNDIDTVKVVGVIRPKKGVVATSINGVVGYTSALTAAMFDHATNHPATQKMIAEYNKVVASDVGTYYNSPIDFSNTDGTNSIGIGEAISVTESGKQIHSEIMRRLGVVDKEYPTSINFYCTSFESKAAIEDFINKYEAETGNKIKYNDSLSAMMSFVNTMTSTITGVLVAFAAISLIVSTIMIAIIIYTSVLERRKEIGVLRSIGARKKDISRVFIAESAILGAYSGVIGIIVSAIISAIGSVILKAVFGISGLMTVTWWHCLMMVLISILLSMLAGFIPSRIAARKDPAIALRSE